ILTLCIASDIEPPGSNFGSAVTSAGAVLDRAPDWWAEQHNFPDSISISVRSIARFLKGG
ncbi:MAG: hypothetical protein KUG52_07615, partial [Immundisolibacteraceae bacterium]|nr:hypothetical protein [Immundisolibacteraceae bacterium]